MNSGSNMSGSDEALLSMLFASGTLVFVLIIIALSFLLIIGMIIIIGIPYYKMAKKLGINNPWLAFIPIANGYIVSIIPQKEIQFYPTNKCIENRAGFYWAYFGITMGISLVSVFFSLIPFIGTLITLFLGFILSIATYYYNFIMLLDVYDTFSTEHTTNLVICIVSIFVPILPIIYAFILCGKEPVFNYTTCTPTYGASNY